MYINHKLSLGVFAQNTTGPFDIHTLGNERQYANTKVVGADFLCTGHHCMRIENPYIYDTAVHVHVLAQLGQSTPRKTLRPKHIALISTRGTDNCVTVPRFFPRLIGNKHKRGPALLEVWSAPSSELLTGHPPESGFPVPRLRSGMSGGVPTVLSDLY